MIPDKDLKKIKDYLEKAENPLFLFDDDNDGLCSFLLFRAFTKKGIGIPIKTNQLDIEFTKIVNTYNTDMIFILDKPVVTQEFVDNIDIPIIWIDHHSITKLKGVKYFNPKLDGDETPYSNTYWCYKVVKGNLWIATLGAISDWTIPDYLKEFKKKYPDLVNNKKTPPEILFNTKFGELCRIFSFLVKDTSKEVKNTIEHILKIKEPYEILNKTSPDGRILFKKSEKMNRYYQSLLKEALKVKTDKNVLVFTYESNNSLTSDLSNELLYKNSNTVIIVGRIKNDEIKMSMRGDMKVKPFLEKALKQVEGYGGGHEHAVGASIKKQDFTKFIDIIKKEVSKATRP